MSKNKHQYVLEEVVNKHSLMNSFDECLKGKLWKESVIMADMYEYRVLNNLLLETYNFEYYPSPFYHCTVNERGKQRDVSSLHFRDRILQKCINQNFFLPAFAPRFIYDNYASLRGKGPDKAMDRLEDFIRTAYLRWGMNFYFLKFDIHSYFDSLYHFRCLDMINEHTQDRRLLKIFEQVMYSYQVDPIIHGGLQLPFGVGLGGELPQSFGISYLDEMDHLIKEPWQIPFYIRYMDDGILIDNNLDHLQWVYGLMMQYLDYIRLSFSPNKTYIVPASEGITFLKLHYYINPDNGFITRKICQETKHRNIRRLYKFKGLLDDGEMDYDSVRSSFASSKGCLLRGDEWQYRDKLNKVFYDLFIEPFIYEYDFDIATEAQAYQEMLEEEAREKWYYKLEHTSHFNKQKDITIYNSL